MSDTPKKKLTDKEKADMAFNALAIKTMETSAKLARVEKQLNQQTKRAAKKQKRASANQRLGSKIAKLATLGKPNQMLQGLADTTKISKKR